MCYLPWVQMIDQFVGGLLGASAALSAKRQDGVGPAVDYVDLALCTAESYLESGSFDPYDAAEKLLEWYRLGPRRLDIVTKRVLQLLDQGFTFERASLDAWRAQPPVKPDPSFLIRSAPVGLVRYHDDIHLIGETRVTTGLTHPDELCKMAAVAFNLAIAHLLLVGTDGMIEEVSEFIAPRHDMLGKAISDVPQLSVRDLRLDGSLSDILTASLWVTLFTTSFEEAISLLAKHHSCSFGVLACSGFLLGVRFGASDIPKVLLDHVDQRRLLEATARNLFKLSQRG